MKAIIKNVISAVILSGFFAVFAVRAQAVDLSPYASYKINVGQARGEGVYFDTGFNSRFAAGAGVELSRLGALRMELEYSDATASFFEYTGTIASGGTNEETSYRLQSKTLLLNAYFDFETGTIFTPYIGCGLGANNATFEINFRGGNFFIPMTIMSDWQPAWNAVMGVGVKLSKALTLDIGYRYTDLGTFKGAAGLYWDDGSSVWRLGEIISKSRFTSHEASLGLRYSF